MAQIFYASKRRYNNSKTPTTAQPYCHECGCAGTQRGAKVTACHAGVEYLLGFPQYEDNQKSEKWLRDRMCNATATFFASCLPKNHPCYYKYAGRTVAFLQKLGLATPFSGNVATRHGEFYEDPALDIYRYLVNGDTIHAFGLLPHRHLANVAGSPDGITAGGIMIEVKCPYYVFIRKNKSFPSVKHYYAQPQVNMEISGTEVGHFIQFKPPLISKTVNATTKEEVRVYETDIDKILKYGDDDTKYKDTMTFKVTEVRRNRAFFDYSLRHVRTLWVEVARVYTENKVPLGWQDMIQALDHELTLQPGAAFVRLYQAYRQRNEH